MISQANIVKHVGWAAMPNKSITDQAISFKSNPMLIFKAKIQSPLGITAQPTKLTYKLVTWI